MNTIEPENKISFKRTEINLQESDVKRFWKYVDKREETSCWPWSGHKDRVGYGKIRIRDTAVLAHRVSWTVSIGVIPLGLCVLHKCDNPCCQNPKHLFLGTYKDNNRDCIQKGRAVFPRGTKHGRAKLTEDDVREIRHKLKLGYKIGDVSSEYGVCRASIRSIELMINWKHVI